MTRRHPLAPLLVAALVIVGVLALHSAHFAARPYRQDEAWRVHGALEHDVRGTVVWIAGNIHPPLWAVISDGWIDLFGDAERIARWLSSLWTALALALVYRLARDCFPTHIALSAALLLGVSAFYTFYGHEFRPYSALVVFTLAAHMTWARWLARPRFGRGLAFVAAGVALAYTHFYGLYVLAALALVTPLVLPAPRRRLAHALALFGLVALGFTGWLLPFVQAITFTRGGGVAYASTADNLGWAARRLHGELQWRPEVLGALLLVVGLLRVRAAARPAAPHTSSRPPNAARYLALVITAVALGVNVFIPTLVERGMIVILPSLAVALSAGVWTLPRPLALVVLALFTGTTVTQFTQFSSHGALPEIAALIRPHYTAGTPLVLSAEHIRDHIIGTYYLAERLNVPIDEALMFHVAAPDDLPDVVMMPRPPRFLATDAAAPDMLAAWLGDAPQVWLVEELSWRRGLGDAARSALQQRYRVYADWDSTVTDQAEIPFRAALYLRVPDDLDVRYRFDDRYALVNWTLETGTDAAPCSAVRLQSWWLATAPPDRDVVLTLAAVGADGVGVAQADSPPARSDTTMWQAERPYLDVRTLSLPCDLAPGAYPLVVGLYAAAPPYTPLAAATPDGAAVGALAYLTTLNVR